MPFSDVIIDIFLQFFLLHIVFCGSRPSASSLIVGGSVARVNSWPWQVMLMGTYGQLFCGGSLVDPYWVVTTANCISGKSPSSIKVK